MTDTKISTERLAVKGEGFDSQSGGFAFIHIGDQRYTKDEVISALASRHQEPVNEPAEVVSGEMTSSRAAYFLERFQRDEKMLGPNEQAALDFAIVALRDASTPMVEPVGYVRPETLAKLREGDAGPIVGVSAYDTTIPLYAAPQPAPVVMDDAMRKIAEEAYWLLAWTWQSHLHSAGKPFDMSIFAPEARDMMNKGEQDLFDALASLQKQESGE